MSIKKYRSYYLYIFLLLLIVLAIISFVKKNNNVDLTGYVKIMVKEKNLDDYWKSIYNEKVEKIEEGWKLNVDTYLHDSYITFKGNEIVFEQESKTNKSNIGKIVEAYFINTNYPKIYMLNENGNVFLLEISLLSEGSLDDSIESIPVSHKYTKVVDIISVSDNKEDLILEDSNEIEYSLNDDIEFDYKYKINYSVLEETDKGTNFIVKKTAYIKDNREVIINNSIIDKKYKMSFAENYDDEPGYFITTDNYLYSVEKENVVGESKIKELYYKPDGYDSIYGSYIVVFNDGNYISFNGSYSEIDFEE